jgi:hypothetical protein
MLKTEQRAENGKTTENVYCLFSNSLVPRSSVVISVGNKYMRYFNLEVPGLCGNLSQMTACSTVEICGEDYDVLLLGFGVV